MTYQFEGMEALAKEAECWETPVWAAESVLDVELMTNHVIDPCCGPGVLSEVARNRGHKVISIDKYDWGYEHGKSGIDFLTTNMFDNHIYNDTTVFMNPPFSLATDFVEKSFQIGIRKIISFQRFAWWESQSRENFWNKYPPNRVYVCRRRATCWRVDIPPEKRGVPVNKGGAGSGSTTAHAWFVWEKGQPPGTVMGHIS